MAHYLLAKDGTIFVVAAGHCNHAGVSLKPTYQNGHRIGIEARPPACPAPRATGRPRRWTPTPACAGPWPPSSVSPS
jgi:hypothetical protein